MAASGCTPVTWATWTRIAASSSAGAASGGASPPGVLGVIELFWGELCFAFVVPLPGVVPTEELKKEILEYCSGRIAKYAMPREIEFRKELPKTLVGKVAYRVLEEEANAKVEAK